LRNFFTIAPYFTLILGVLAIGLLAFALIRVSSKEWTNWYHNASLLQLLGLILLMVGYIIAALIQITHTTMEPILAILDLGFLLFILLGGFFIFRVYWIRPRKEDK